LLEIGQVRIIGRVADLLANNYSDGELRSENSSLPTPTAMQDLLVADKCGIAWPRLCVY